METFYVLWKRGFAYSNGGDILCEDGHFHSIGDIIDNDKYTPILFASRGEAKQAKRIYRGHWPEYKIIEITDPSWLN